MTKQDIANALSERINGLQKSTATAVVDQLSDILSDAFASGENVYLRGFGTFQVKQTKEKPARNISTGEQVMVPAQRVVRFKVSNNLKSRINERKAELAQTLPSAKGIASQTKNRMNHG